MKWEYAMLSWWGANKGAHRELIFSHWPAMLKIDGSLADLLRRLGDDGWEMVNAHQPNPTTAVVLEHPIFAAFKRPLVTPA